MSSPIVTNNDLAAAVGGWGNLLDHWLRGENPVNMKITNPSQREEDLAIWTTILDHAVANSGRTDIAGDGIVHPSVEEFIGFIRQALMEAMSRVPAIVGDLEDILVQRGRDYGEEVLVVMGESGIAEFVKVKVWRLQGSIQEQRPENSRRDSWVDIAGYAVLQLALAEWMKEQNRGRS